MTGGLIELREVSHCYGAVRALDSVTLAAGQGAIGLVGQNGAGKSTLMQILLGLLRPTRGAVRVLGRDVRRQPLAARGRIGYMPEREALVPALKGVEYVALAGQLSGMARRQAWRRAHETLSYLGLDEARYRYVEQYSVGMQQRIKLAAALVHDPDLLLLDEPTAGLDPEGRTAMLDVLRALAHRPRKSLIMSTHVLPDIERVCSRVLVLDGGRLLADDTIEGLRKQLPRAYRVRFQGEADRIQELARALGSEIRGSVRADEATLLVPADFASHRLFASALERGLLVTGLTPDEENLEDAYRRLVGGVSRSDTTPAQTDASGSAIPR